MKKIILLTLLLICASSAMYAQGKVPIAVKTAFDQKFQNATNIKWSKENKHEYEAEFTYQGTNYSANFKDNGDWLETESPITFDALPQGVKDWYKNPRIQATIKNIMKIENCVGFTKYEVELKVGNKTREYLYDTEGRPMHE